MLGLSIALLGAAPLITYALPASQVNDKRWESDACAVVAGKALSEPSDVLKCLRSFPLNQTTKANALDVVASVIPQYTYEYQALAAPAPFQESTVNLQAELARIRTQDYETDYDFNLDLYQVINRLNDGHTLWEPACYIDAFQNILPIPIISLAANAYGSESIYVVPDANDFFADFLDGAFAEWYSEKGINITRYAGAEITEIDGLNPYEYVSKIASEYSGNYLDHGVRMNSVYSSYRLVAGGWGQRLGDFAGPVVPSYPEGNKVTVCLTPTDTGVSETVTFPYVSTYIGKGNFSDKASYWANNCAATDATNGIDYKLASVEPSDEAGRIGNFRGPAKAALPVTNARTTAIGLPEPYQPTLKNETGGNDVLFFSMLPDTSKKTGVLMIGSFSPTSYANFPASAKAGFDYLLDQGAEYLIIDVTNNGGGYVCLGQFLYRLLAGPAVDSNPGFQSVIRDSPLGRDIMKSNIELEKSYNYSAIEPYYWPSSWNHIDAPVAFAPTDNFMEPPVELPVNGKVDLISKRTADECTPWSVQPYDYQPFDLSKVAIVGNGNCASTCAQFTSILDELNNITIANFGSAKGGYNGLNGAEVLEWVTFDSEVKTANQKNNSLAGPDLLINANFRHNWRATFSYIGDTETYMAYYPLNATRTYAYTKDTYNSPEALWSFAAKDIFGV